MSILKSVFVHIYIYVYIDMYIVYLHIFYIFISIISFVQAYPRCSANHIPRHMEKLCEMKRKFEPSRVRTLNMADL